MCIGDQFSYSVLWVVLWTSVTKYYANFWELLLPTLWPPSRFRNWQRLLSEAFARCVKNLKRRARVSWYVATLFACPSTTTSGACDHKLANNSNAAHMDPIIKKIFRSLKSVEQYFASAGPGAHVPIMSVTDMYYFDRSTYMVILLPTYLQLNSCIIYYWNLC